MPVDVFSPQACRVGRAFLHWTQSRLAAEAPVSVDLVRAFEQGASGRRMHPNHIASILVALADAGVEFRGDGSVVVERPNGR